MDSIAWLSYYLNLVWAYGSYYLLYFFNLYEDYPPEVQVAGAVTSFSVIGIVLICFGMCIKVRKRTRDEKLTRRLDKRYGKVIEYLFSVECKTTVPKREMAELLDIADYVKEKKEVLRNKREKRLFCYLIYYKRIAATASCGHRQNLHNLIDLFSLREFLENEASLGNVYHKCDALEMLRTFKLYISPWVINKQLNSKNKYVQRLAMYSSIMSSADSDLDYFETSFFDDNCCIHDEIELGYVLQRRRKNGLKLPNLASWAAHQKKPNTKCVFVRLMRRFDQREYCFQLETLFRNSEHKKLIEEISRTWGYLYYDKSEPLLTESLLMQPDDTKVAIMHALTRMATGKSLNVLVEEFQVSTNPHVRFEALRCLYNYGEAGREKFYELEAEATEREQKFFSFFHNPITLAKIRLDKEQAYHPSVETVYNSDI